MAYKPFLTCRCLSAAAGSNNTVIVDRHIRVFPNQKPWTNRKVKKLLRERNSAHRFDGWNLHSCARTALKRCTRKAKAEIKQMIDEDFSRKNITNFRSSNTTAISRDATLAKQLNHFSAADSQTFSVQMQKVRRTLRAVNPSKSCWA